MSAAGSRLTDHASRVHARRGPKAVFFLMEGINAFAASYYFNYLFFLLRDRFGFGNRENLAVSALHGFIYIFAAWQCGKFAERRGFLTSLRVGFCGMAVALLVASQLHSVTGQLVALALWTIAMMFTWPALEALVSVGETRAGVQRMVGIYNCVWSGSAALACFIGGAFFEALGVQSLYWLPAGLHGAQLLLLVWIGKKTSPPASQAAPAPAAIPHEPEPAALRQPIRPKTFLNMAWLANPFAYVAINTVLAVIPELAKRFDLTVTASGFVCSIWFVTRLATFALLWHWTGWHYRFRWLAAAFMTLIASFAMLLLAQKLWLLVLAQIGFGAAVGLIYYSSLFYSMDVGETKGEHGGIHEAFIGLGICVGPAIGATALQLTPQYANAGTYAVSALLCMGLAGLVWLRARK